jgi:hypothetical protein
VDFKAREFLSPTSARSIPQVSSGPKNSLSFFTRQHTLKERCAVVHAPGEDSPDHSSARSRQTAQQRVEMAYAHAPHMLAHDRRVLDVPLQERLQSRTTELVAWARTMLPVINRSVRDASQLQTGHHDIRNYSSNSGHPRCHINNTTSNE